MRIDVMMLPKNTVHYGHLCMPASWPRPSLTSKLDQKQTANKTSEQVESQLAGSRVSFMRRIFFYSPLSTTNWQVSGVITTHPNLTERVHIHEQQLPSPS